MDALSTDCVNTISRGNIYFIRMRSVQFRGVYFVSERRSTQSDSLSYQDEEVMKFRSKRRPVKVQFLA
ncbi:MAG: hypothetical protein AAF599_15480, partial [Bacteroidota bacterium]